MKIISTFFLGLTLIACATRAGAQQTGEPADPAAPASPAPVVVQNGDTPEPGPDLGQFGFGPAFFVVDYKEEILQDTKDVRVRGDGSISASGSEFSTAIGLEAHYSFAFNSKCRLNGAEITFSECEKNKGAKTSGHTVSPFLGLYDLDNGINGIAAGAVYGYWRGDYLTNGRTSLNVGLGWTVHKDRLVLANDVSEGAAPPAGLAVEDYTERKDVEGLVIMISASIGF